MISAINRIRIDQAQRLLDQAEVPWAIEIDGKVDGPLALRVESKEPKKKSRGIVIFHWNQWIEYPVLAQSMQPGDTLEIDVLAYLPKEHHGRVGDAIKSLQASFVSAARAKFGPDHGVHGAASGSTLRFWRDAK